MISQAQAARLIAAHEKAVTARGFYSGLTVRGARLVLAHNEWKDTERAFQELLATLIDENDR